jgi:hypothetical protein
MTETTLLTDPAHTRGDLRQMESAIRKGWQIPDALFERAGIVIGQILSKGTNREKVAAARVLIAMNEQNNPTPVVVAHQHLHVAAQAPVESDIDQKRRELAGRIARLG